MSITWAAIAAETGNYKAGFVAIFRKYEGQNTDEKDAAGRTVKVTQKSFARHMGIAESTFTKWVRTGKGLDASPSDKQATARYAKSVVRNHPDAVIDAIMELPETHRDTIYHEVKLRRAGIDTSKANRKAAEAHAHEFLEPIVKATKHMGHATHLTMAAGVINEVADDIEAAKEEGFDMSPYIAEINAATNRLRTILDNIEFHNIIGQE